jgi:hypothetical protein
MSSTPHSSASHHNSAVLVELTSRTGMDLHLTASTKSVQLPSLSARSVITMVLSSPESSKPAAALIVRAHRNVMPRASISFSMPGSGLLAPTTMTVFADCSVRINISSARLHGSPLHPRIAVSCRKLPVCIDVSAFLNSMAASLVAIEPLFDALRSEERVTSLLNG